MSKNIPDVKRRCQRFIQRNRETRETHENKTKFISRLFACFAVSRYRMRIKTGADMVVAPMLSIACA
jgi:hypothetical protein